MGVTKMKWARLKVHLYCARDQYLSKDMIDEEDDEIMWYAKLLVFPTTGENSLSILARF